MEVPAQVLDFDFVWHILRSMSYTAGGSSS